MKTVYAIIDTRANDVAGPLQLINNDVAAIRFFSDVCATNGTLVHQHPEDFELVALGEMETDIGPVHLIIDAQPRVVITGQQWLAAQQPKES